MCKKISSEETGKEREAGGEKLWRRVRHHECDGRRRQELPCAAAAGIRVWNSLPSNLRDEKLKFSELQAPAENSLV